VPRFRPSLTIPGTAPLGAYEGGETVVIDSMVSASANSINELRTGRSLLGGMDPVEARRIMTERGADRSDDYAALLGSLVRGRPSCNGMAARGR
jgi:hypothetical protein